MFDEVKSLFGGGGWRGGGRARLGFDQRERWVVANATYTGRIAPLILAVLIASSSLEAAPAPLFKGLPEEVENLVRAYTVGRPHSIESVKQDIRTASTKEEQDRRVRDLELLQWELYCRPVEILEMAMKDPRYQSHRDQEAIRRALEKHRQRYQDAKRMGLCKPKPPPPEAKPKGWHEPVPPPSSQSKRARN